MKSPQSGRLSQLVRCRPIRHFARGPATVTRVRVSAAVTRVRVSAAVTRVRVRVSAAVKRCEPRCHQRRTHRITATAAWLGSGLKLGLGLGLGLGSGSGSGSGLG
eukprot:scaffold115395_cov45-Phaeocystis_antarctica.AAC.1